MHVIITSRSRHDFLAVTLGCLYSQQIDENLTVTILMHERQNEAPPSYLLEQMMRLGRERLSRIKLDVRYVSPDLSLAHHRAQAILSSPDEWVAMMDNDVWFPPGTLAYMRRYANNWFEGAPNEPVLAFCLSHVDVWNQREYPDYSTEVYHDVDDYKSQHDHTGAGFQRYRRTGLNDYSHTHALWNKKALIDSGVIAMWLKWPVGVREYDYQGSLHAVKQGYSVLQLANRSGQHNHDIAFWHLWTVKDDAGYFDVKGQFGASAPEPNFDKILEEQAKRPHFKPAGSKP